MYDDLVARIAVESKRDYDSDIQPPATEESLRRLRQRAHDELGSTLPDGYLDFLRVTDGLNWNGLFVYASEKALIVGEANDFMSPFVDSNLIWRDNELNKNYLFFADGEISLYAYNLVKECYELQDRPSGDVIRTFKTFDEMITEALKASLYEDEEKDD